MASPLGMKIGIVYVNTRVIQKSNNKAYKMPETIRVNLLVRRDNYYEFVYKGNSYLVHADNVTIE